MHGFSSGFTFILNAEVDSMGGVVDGGVGIGMKPSPRRAAIEKAQADLRVEYDVREERRRELEFLEKGGNPLDFKFGHAAAASVQSTSHTDQQPDQLLTSEAKGSFAFTASPHGDSVESSGRLGVTTACEPNSADNFDGENELLDSGRKSKYPGRGSITPSEHSSQLDGSLNVKESEESPIFHPKKGQAYRRRNRSRTSRDGPKSSSTEVATLSGHSSLPGRHGMLSKPIGSENQLELESTNSRGGENPEGKADVSTGKDQQEELQDHSVKAEEAPIATSTVLQDVVAEREVTVPVDVECPTVAAEKSEDNATMAKMNEFSKINGDSKCLHSDALVNDVVQTTKGLDSESSCTQTSTSVEGNGNIDSDLHTNLKSVDRNGAPKELELSHGDKLICNDDKLLNEKHEVSAVDTVSGVEDPNMIGDQGNGFAHKDQEEADKSRAFLREDVKALSTDPERGTDDHMEIKSDVHAGPPQDPSPKAESPCTVAPSQPPVASCSEINKTDTFAVLQPQPSSEEQRKLIDKAHEDRILEEARIIEAKRKRLAELSVGLVPREHRPKSQWDFVLEEMAWLANDFSQERVWKICAAAGICHRVAFASRARLEEQNKRLKHKIVAHTLAKAVMEFWHSAGSHVDNVDSSLSQNTMQGSSATTHVDSRVECPNEDKPPGNDLQSVGRRHDYAVYGYAVRFLQSNCSSKPPVTVEDLGTQNVVSDVDIQEVPWQDQFTEDDLFYVVQPGAMENYRRSIESCLTESEKTANNMQEEVDTSMFDADYEYQENDYEEDEGDNVCYFPGAFDDGKASKKKRKNKSFVVRSYESGGDFGYRHCMDNRTGNPQSTLMGKRPANSLHVGPIPTKRMRTASRQRVVGPYNAASTGIAPAPSRAEASSGDTNSFQDDQSTLHGGCNLPRGSEVDSPMDFEKQCTFDSIDISAKPKKKKKNKHQAPVYDQRWQIDSPLQTEQKDNSRKRSENHQFESNGNSGFFGQHPKKQKIMKLPLDNSYDNTVPMSGSVASPVASQMSNMSSQSKIIKLFGGRDRGRKAKGLKVATGQPGSGSPWSLFEDQALVVLVHDMGPNWELVSDAINSTLQFKCIYRKPQECKERHKSLMDRTCSDGADSAEDSGSSQPYPSTLPGIPKGSARQLFQRLQGPMEEDTIKSHFEKIMHIGQQLHYRKRQNEIQELKQIAPVHGSHMVALSQVFPNNVNGGVLTPLDLCDVATSGQDVLPLGYQGPQGGGLPLSNQGTIAPMHPSGGHNSSLQGLQGSPGMSIGNNLASPSSQFNGPRDARYAVPRSGSLPIDEQHRLQQYNNMLPGRNGQPSNLASSGPLSGNDRGVRMLPGRNGPGVVGGTNRSMPIPRPGPHTSAVLNSGSMVGSNMGGMPSNMNMHSGAAPAQGNSMFRPRDALHVVRPGQSSDHQRQLMVPEMQGSQANTPGVPPFGAMSSGFTNQTASPPVQTYSGHHQQQHPHLLNSHHPHLSGSNHSASLDQQTVLRITREKQMHSLMQRQPQHQHHQLSVSSPLMAHGQTPGQLPASSSLQSGSHLQSQGISQSAPLPLASSSAMTPVAQTQQQPKHQLPSHGLVRNPQSGATGMINQSGKQRQRSAQQLQQQYQQSGRQHPQQRQQSQPQQQAKLLKGIGGRGNMLMQQNLPVDPSHLNGVSASSGSQVAEKVEQSGPLKQGQGLYSGSLPSSKLVAPSQTAGHPQPPKSYSNTVPATSKHGQRMTPHLDSSNHGQIQGAPASAIGASSQGVPSSVLPTLNNQQLQPPKVVNQPPPGSQRPIQQSRPIMSSDPLKKLQANHSPVEKQFTNNTPNVNASGIPASTSSVSTTSQKAQESLSDSSMPSSSAPLDSISNPALSKSSGNESMPSASQGLGQRQLSGNLVAQGHSVETPWQQEQSHLNQSPQLQPSLPQKQSQQQLQQLEQSAQKVPQHPQPHLQAGHGNMISHTANSRLE